MNRQECCETRKSTLLVDFEARKLAHIIVEVRGFKSDPQWRFVASPLYQKCITLRLDSSDVIDWQRRGIDVVIASLQAVSQDSVNGEFKTIGFSHTLQTFH
jgi:hypothetical protein